MTGSELRPPGEALDRARSTRRTESCSRRSGLGRAEVERASRRRRGSGPSRRPRARARGRRPRHLGRGFGRPARPGSVDPGRARRRGGVLGRRGEAGQADLVRRCAETLVFGLPGIRCRCLWASSSSSARLCWRFRAQPIQGRLRTRRARLAAEPQPRSRRARTSPSSRDPRRPASSTHWPARSRT